MFRIARLRGALLGTAAAVLLLTSACGDDSASGEVCGNGVVEGVEECDDNNTTDGDGCAADCTLEVTPGCGNGVVEGVEECDDGNTTACDGCSATCEDEACGNSVIECGEACDDGNTVDGDGCAADCTLEVAPGCGNGVVELTEECDDGNTTACDGCSATCEDEVCGNGVTECTEECDDGNVTDGDGCSAACTDEPVCGDDVIEGAEDCDGSELGGATCTTIPGGFTGGILDCATGCTFDTTGCTAAAPRLIVAADDGSGHGLFVWIDPDTLVSDVAPDVVVQHSSASNSRSLAVTSSSVFVTTSQTGAALLVFAAPHSLAAGSVPTATIPRASLPGATGAPEHVVLGGGASDVVILSSFDDGSYLFTGSAALSNASTPAAQFTHAWQQLPSVALDPVANRLISGQISGAGLLAWDNATSATGSPTHDTVVSSDSVWDLALDATRTYGAGSVGGGNGLGVWTTSALSAPAAPLFVLGSTEGVNSFVEDIEVDNDVLIACMQGGTGGPRVLLWTNASALSAPVAATATVSLTEVPRRAELSSTGMLYVLTSTGIRIYSTPTTTPTLVATITGSGTVSNFQDFALTH